LLFGLPGPLGEFHAHFEGHARLVNVYGPTETSCVSSSPEIDEAALMAAGTGVPSVGRMHRDFGHMILDESDTPVERRAAGELWIGCANVGLGYYQAPDETSRRFR
jgi:D-alanine--poly(phosphoribitol) ligase subunit 1